MTFLAFLPLLLRVRVGGPPAAHDPYSGGGRGGYGALLRDRTFVGV